MGCHILTLRCVIRLVRKSTDPLVDTVPRAGHQPERILHKCIVVCPGNQRLSHNWMHVHRLEQTCRTDVRGDIWTGGFDAAKEDRIGDSVDRLSV
jgi:hypothetical protein